MDIYAIAGIVIIVLGAVLGWVFKINNKVTKHNTQITSAFHEIDKINALELATKLGQIETHLLYIRTALERDGKL